MKLIALVLTFATSLTSFAAVVTTQDTKNNCTVYRNTSKNSPQLSGEYLFEDSDLYGFALRDMAIDFDKKIVTMRVLKMVVLGLDRSFFKENVFVDSRNPEISNLINELNRDVNVFDKICVTNQGELMWATPIAR